MCVERGAESGERQDSKGNTVCDAKSTQPADPIAYREFRAQWQRLCQQRTEIDGKLALLSQVLSLFE